MIDHYLVIAYRRQQYAPLCETCGGLGSIPTGVIPGDESPCLACHSSRLERGRCSCGAEGTLVPDLAVMSDGTSNGAVLVCPKCAVTCACGRVSIACDSDSKEQFCRSCWERNEQMLNEQDLTVN